MIKKINLLSLTLIAMISACKKPSSSNVDPRITANYLFKPGTYWTYSDPGGNTDSQYVVATGSKNGLPYRQINEVLNGLARATIYIGVGPASHQLQLWGYNFNGNATSQAIFDVDTPAIGTVVATALFYEGIGTQGGATPYNITGQPLIYGVNYPTSIMNQEYGNVDYYFYPGYGIVQRTEYGTPLGDLYWNLSNAHIIQ